MPPSDSTTGKILRLLSPELSDETTKEIHFWLIVFSPVALLAAFIIDNLPR